MTKLIQKLSIIQRDLKAPKSQTNNFGKYKYRSCEDILQSVKPILDGLVLTLTDEVIAISDRVYVKATACISDGSDYINVHGWARESVTKKGMDDSQITGSASSYARKYALNGLLCIDDTQDADSLNDHGKAPIKKWQIEEITQLVSLCDANIAKGCIHVSKKRTDKVDELKGAEADKLIELLLIKAKAKKDEGGIA